MQVVDVNVLVCAHRAEAGNHAVALAWLEAAVNGVAPLGVFEPVLASFVRLVTNRRVFPEPTNPDEALRFCELIRTAPNVIPVAPGGRHWEVFAGLCRELNVRGNLVPDAYLAALAIEQGATLVTFDRGFARFPGLRWQLPASA